MGRVVYSEAFLLGLKMTISCLHVIFPPRFGQFYLKYLIIRFENIQPLVLKLHLYQNHPEDLFKQRLRDPSPIVSDLVGLGWGPRISKKLLTGSQAVLMLLFQGPDLENHYT